MKDGLVEDGSVVAERREADDIEEIADRNGSGSGGVHEDAMVGIHEGKLLGPEVEVTTPRT